MRTPVVLFVYNRPLHVERTVESLLDNDGIERYDLYVYSDGPKNPGDEAQVERVRNYVRGEKRLGRFATVSVSEEPRNKGLAKSVIEGVTPLVEEYGQVIVVEDDLVCSRDFLQYMANGLDFFRQNARIWSISGFCPALRFPSDYQDDTFLCVRASSWGWATWRDRWRTVDWSVADFPRFKRSWLQRWHFNRGGPDLSRQLDLQMSGRIDSWAIRWCYSQHRQQMYTVYPRISKILNAGLDGSGTHSHAGDALVYAPQFIKEGRAVIFSDLSFDPRIQREFSRKFARPLTGRIANRIRKIVRARAPKGKTPGGQ